MNRTVGRYVALITNFTLAIIIAFSGNCQTRLTLQKGRERVIFHDQARVGIVSKTDSIPYRDGCSIEKVGADSLVLKDYTRYEYSITPYDSAKIKFCEGWSKYGLIKNGSDSSEKWQYRIRKAMTAPGPRSIAYADIQQIQYRKNEPEGGCIICFVFPLMMVLAPVVSWDNGRFQRETFQLWFGVGLGGSALFFMDINSKKIRKYHMGKWHINTLAK